MSLPKFAHRCVKRVKMRGPSLVRILKERFVIVVFDKKDNVIACDTKMSSKEAAETADLYKDSYKKHRVSVYKLTPCRF